MRQRTAIATTDTRRWSRALRALLLLGGFVLLWWCLATGTAQASDGPSARPDHGLGATAKALGSTADHVVHQTTKRAVDRVRHTSKPVKAVRQAPVAAEVRSTIRRSPVAKPVVRTVVKPVMTTVVKPTVKTTTETVRVQAAAVLEGVVKTLSTTPLPPALSPAVDDVTEVVDHSLTSPESPIQAGEKASVDTSLDPHSTQIPAFSAGTSAAPVTLSADAADDLDRAAPSSPVEQQHQGDHGFRSTGGSGASSTQSGSGHAPGAGVCQGGTALTPPTTKTSIDTSAARPTAGPAYPPSCSPD